MAGTWQQRIISAAAFIHNQKWGEVQMTSIQIRAPKKRSLLYRLVRNVIEHPWLYILSLPVVAYYLIFCYWPMYGVIIAFMDYNPVRGMARSNWVGLENFYEFFGDMYFTRVVRNTFTINLGLLIFEFPFTIAFAIMLNEIRSVKFQKLTQTVTYLPHFVSSVVICGLMLEFCKSNGLLTSLFATFGMEKVNLLTKTEWFQPLYILMNIWQEFGWNSIIFFAALAGISPELYEAAMIDGAGRFRQIIHITLPSLSGTIVILLVLRIGNLMNLGWDKIYLLYNELVYETADVISTMVYRRGLLQFDYSFGTAAGLFNSVINVLLLLTANFIANRYSDGGLW